MNASQDNSTARFSLIVRAQNGSSFGAGIFPLTQLDRVCRSHGITRPLSENDRIGIAALPLHAHCRFLAGEDTLIVARRR